MKNKIKFQSSWIYEFYSRTLFNKIKTMTKKDFDSFFINIFSKLVKNQNKREQYEDLKVSFYNEGKLQKLNFKNGTFQKD